MIVRNGEYIYVDGTLASTDGLQSVYISRTKQGIVFQYLNGHRIDIAYDNPTYVDKAWKEIKSDLADFTQDNILYEVHDAMLIRTDSILHIEFDEIDYRFAILYKNGECFVFDFASKTITFGIFRMLMQKYFGITEYKAVNSRHRASFWKDITATVRGKIDTEQNPNEDYWTKLDKALMDANRGIKT